MSRKCGTDRFPTQEEAGVNALSRANELEQELAAEIPEAKTADLIPAKVSWPDGRMDGMSDPVMANRTKSRHCDKCALPLDFKMFDFTDLEENTRQLFHMKDEWMYRDGESPRITDQSTSTILHPERIDDWWSDVRPEMDVKLVPLVKEMMGSGYTKSTPVATLCSLTLQQLVDGGSAEQARMAAMALELLKGGTPDRAGNVHVPTIIWGPRMKCAEFESHDVSFGALHFAAIDMGEGIKLNNRMRRLLGSESDSEGNQFVTKHIAMGLEWKANKCHARIPSRNRVEILASELRMGEYQKAAVCYERVCKPVSLMEYEMWPNAHESMSVGHDRNFKKLGWLLKGL